MPPRVSRWGQYLRQRLRRVGNNVVPLQTRPADADSDSDSDPGLPFLAESSASRVSLTDVPVTEDANAHNPFFSRLPPEIRHQILMEAFGGRTLHMDVRLSPPMLPVSKREPSVIAPFELPHGGIGADLDRFSGWPVEVLKAAVEARVITPIDINGDDKHSVSPWQWWSCVCHRGMPHAVSTTSLCEDQCVHGSNTYCGFYAGKAPGKCLVGCTGYAEGIQVLYGTNTINLQREILTDAILRSTDLSSGSTIPPAIVPTAHLARITRLEIAWDLSLATQPFHDDKQAAARASLVERLAHLARSDAFPRLAHLVLAFGDSLYQRPTPPATCLEDLDKGLLDPLRAMTAEFWKSRQAKVEKRKGGSRNQDAPILQLTVELPTNTFNPLYERTVRCGGVYEQGQSYYQRRFWRVSIVKVDEDGMPAENQEEKEYEKKEGDEDDENTDKRHKIVDCGFWVKAGIESRLNFDYQGNPYRLGTVATLH
ncbi:hypothetical protein Sste5344_006617 [Sporothrix stenoceras]